MAHYSYNSFYVCTLRIIRSQLPFFSERKVADEGRPGGVVDQRSQRQLLHWQNISFLQLSISHYWCHWSLSVAMSDRGFSIHFVPEDRIEWVSSLWKRKRTEERNMWIAIVCLSCLKEIDCEVQVMRQLSGVYSKLINQLSIKRRR